MKIISETEAQNCWRLPIIDKRAKDGLPPYGSEWRVFPHISTSWEVMVFSRAYLDVVSEWWAKWKFTTGFKYEPGSAMCESGVKIFIGHVHESVFPFRGHGSVPKETLEEAARQGVIIPTERLGDFTPGVFEMRVIIPRGSSINGVADGAHATAGLLVHDGDQAVHPVVWEWQNQRWCDWQEAVDNGITLSDITD